MTAVSLDPTAFSTLVGPVEHAVDDRWLVAYASGIFDRSPALVDVERTGGIVAHPVFCACVEWPLVQRGTPGIAGMERIAHRGVHVSHEIALRRPIRAGDRLRSSARLLAAEQRSIGLFARVLFETVDDTGALVAETHHETIYLGVKLNENTASKSDTPGVQGSTASADPPDARSSSAGTRASADSPGARSSAAGANSRACDVSAPSPGGAAHAIADAELRSIGGFDVGEADAVVYTECARIWNPIHTDPRVARAAGLPGPILHGTATLARAVSRVIAEHLDADPARVTGLGCRFTGMVPLGTHVDVLTATTDDQHIAFVARTPNGAAVLDAGFVSAASSP